MVGLKGFRTFNCNVVRDSYGEFDFYGVWGHGYSVNEKIMKLEQGSLFYLDKWVFGTASHHFL